MTIRMLVDALHEEETRVVIADDNHVLDFDIESSSKRQVKGNIYLAKVTRVEPSLQAAFVEYGAGRQGFLPFSEIHPDYYQIPVADRQELLAAQAAEHEAAQKAIDDELYASENQPKESFEAENSEGQPVSESSYTPAEITADVAEYASEASDSNPDNNSGNNIEVLEAPEEKTMEEIGGDDALEQRPRRSNIRRYKIQEVIKKNQVMLIQVIKEERGNKGASVTTYISLPGRYCVLMPNTSHGGGVSRKINDAKERRKLKELLDGLELNSGMSLIIRTAGMGQSKAEIARDYSYLIRLWNKIRELTLTSSAPALVYEEGNVLKRTIRDFLGDEIEEVIVAGEKAFETAQEFVKMLLPAQVDKVVKHDDILPVFQKFGVERHLSSMYDSTVVMRSGGYLVINPTEALISIDINSGRATGERNVEDTATRINIEAAHEIARQLRLRDLAGLIVIDFIDMMDSRHRRAVERALKDALRADRAKIQVGRISPFGLLEMSRQRLRPSLNEIQMIECPTCKGAGHIRSFDSAMLQLMRAIESEIALADYDNFDVVRVHVAASAELAVHFLNQKRRHITALEEQYNFQLVVNAEHLAPGSFNLQLEDSNGSRSRIISSDDRESRLPQSRGGEKGGRNNRRDRGKNRNKNRDKEDNFDSQKDEPKEVIANAQQPEVKQEQRHNNKDRNRHNQHQRGEQRFEKRAEDSEHTELAENAEGEESTTQNAENISSRPQRGDRYEGRRGRRNRGRRNNFERKENLEGNAEANEPANNEPQIEGQVVPQYSSEQQHNAQPSSVVEFEKPQQSQDGYETASENDDSSDKPRKGGWWKKIIE